MQQLTVNFYFGGKYQEHYIAVNPFSTWDQEPVERVIPGTIFNRQHFKIKMFKPDYHSWKERKILYKIGWVFNAVNHQYMRIRNET